jgi:hypothetical protein
VAFGDAVLAERFVGALTRERAQRAGGARIAAPGDAEQREVGEHPEQRAERAAPVEQAWIQHWRPRSE